MQDNNKKIPVIIDTDPGIDDAAAIAIALYSERLNVKLITTVAGNVSVDKVTYNALRLLKFFKKSVPVAKGAAAPLISPLIDASDIHGVSGLEGYDFEEPDEGMLLKENAVQAMYRVLMESDELVTILPIGPLTNIALLLKVFPEVKDKIGRIILMGGSTGRGNKGVMAEFNIAVDPEAAKIVFNSGIPFVMAGLDVGLKALVYPHDSEKLLHMNETGRMLYAMFQKYRGGSLKTGLKMYDSCAVAYLLEPDMFETQDAFIDVEINGTLTSGCTIVDLKGYLNKPANGTACLSIDEVKFKEWFLNGIAKCN